MGYFVSHFAMSVIRFIFVSVHYGTGYGINTKLFPGMSRSYLEPDSLCFTSVSLYVLCDYSLRFLITH